MREREILMWYDGPRLSVLEDVDGSPWLAVSIGDDFSPEHQKSYPALDWPMFCVQVTEQLVDLVMADQVTLLNVFKLGKNPTIHDYGTSVKLHVDFEVPEEFYPGDVMLHR